MRKHRRKPKSSGSSGHLYGSDTATSKAATQPLNVGHESALILHLMCSVPAFVPPDDVTWPH